jgi:peptidoglycan/xylan/chitin deacetylase (PgdA/CDA1 family)
MDFLRVKRFFLFLALNGFLAVMYFGTPLLFTIGVHIEPFGETIQGFSRDEKTSYWNVTFFNRHCENLLQLADLVERYGGKLTIQVQSPFTQMVIQQHQTILRDLEKRGHEIALHFHEDAHLGKNCEQLPVSDWIKAMKEEIDLIHQAGVQNPILYYSGGNLYPDVFEAAAGAGLTINGDWKNPQTQSLEPRMVSINPWRPAGGYTKTSSEAFLTHDPNGKVIYLPQGMIDATDFSNKNTIVKEKGNAGWLQVIAKGLAQSVAQMDPEKVNVFHFTIHGGEMVGTPKSGPFPELEAFLRDTLSPYLQQGKVKWATFTEKAKAYEEWEKAVPTSTSASTEKEKDPEKSKPARGYITFVINVHDIANVNHSADTVIRFAELFEKYGVKGDFYLTGAITRLYMEQRPDVIEVLKKTGMTISYHFRPPHIAYTGFDDRLKGLSQTQQTEILRDYETYHLDLTTGMLDTSKSGGYTLVKEVFGEPPVTVSALNPQWRAIQWSIYREMGAQMTLAYHEEGANPENPFEYKEGLLLRPSDIGVTEWKDPENPRSKEDFWWNHVSRDPKKVYNPVKYLQQRLKEWKGDRLPFITSLIHENNVYAKGSTWYAMFCDQSGDALTPPYQVDNNQTEFRSEEECEAIWRTYESLIQFACKSLEVVTSKEIVQMAQ